MVKLREEGEIRPEIIIKKEVVPVWESSSTVSLTLQAIRKALAYIGADLKFDGRVWVFVDNKSAASLWKKSLFDQVLASHFAEVEIKGIPRAKNRKADKLVRENKFVLVPIADFAEMMVKMKCASGF